MSPAESTFCINSQGVHNKFLLGNTQIFWEQSFASLIQNQNSAQAFLNDIEVPNFNIQTRCFVDC